MTSVAQLPLEAASAKPTPNGETPRARGAKSNEEIAEGEFAALLAQVLPQLAPAPKAVEGPVVPAEALEAAGAGSQLPEGGMPAAAPLFTVEVLPQELVVEVATKEIAKLDAVRAEAPVDGLQVPELTDSEMSVEQGEHSIEQPQIGVRTPRPLALESTAAISAEPMLAPPGTAAPKRTGEPERQSSHSGMQGEGAAESRRFVETSAATTEPGPEDDFEAVAFQVRRASASQDARRSAESFEWVRATANQSMQSQPQQIAVRPIAPRAAGEATESAVTEQIRPTVSRDAVTPAADATRGEDHGQEGAPADRRHSNAELETGEGLQEAAAKSVQSGTVRPAPEIEAKQCAPKPVATALPMNAVQANVQTEQPAAQPRGEMAAATPARPPRALEVAAQMQQQYGRTTLNVVLQDERLGRVALQLVERGGWIETAIRASDPRTAQALSNSAAGLFGALQQRGLSFTTSGGSASPWDAQEGQRRDNPQRDHESPGRRFRLRRSASEFAGALPRGEV